jgi:uncharacterized BrkB/YihY/UPF0761 family membrane protein
MDRSQHRHGELTRQFAHKVPDALTRAWERVWSVVWTACLSFDREAGTRQAAQLSFFLLMTFPALLLLAVWVLSNIFDSPDVRTDIVNRIVDAFPLDQVDGRQQILDLLNGLTKGAGGIGIVTTAVLIYSATSVISALRHVVETANEMEANGPSFPKNKGLDILILLVTLPALLLVIGLGVSRPLADAVDQNSFLDWVAGTLGGPLGIGGFGILLLTWLFWVLNPGRTPLKSTFFGALVAAVLILTGIRIWFNASGGGSDVYGVIASFLGVLICLNFFSIAIVFGAHMAATVRLKPWREVLLPSKRPPPPDGQVS